MERLDLRLVEDFVAVAEELHFGRAAARLHVAPPSLSQQILRLEQQLGGTLLQRSSRRVELTPAGAALLRESRQMLTESQRALDAVRAAGRERAARESIAFAELRDESFITGPRTQNPKWRSQWLAEQRRHGMPGRVAAEAVSVQEILTLVATGRGVCLVPAPAACLYPRNDVAYVPVNDADPAVVSVAWTRQTLRPVVDAFIQTARQVAARQRAEHG